MINVYTILAIFINILITCIWMSDFSGFKTTNYLIDYNTLIALLTSCFNLFNSYSLHNILHNIRYCLTINEQRKLIIQGVIIPEWLKVYKIISDNKYATVYKIYVNILSIFNITNFNIS